MNVLRPEVSALNLPIDTLERELRESASDLHRHEDEPDEPDAPGEFTDHVAFGQFLRAGRAIFTVESRRSGERFTFRVSRPDAEPGRQRPLWVSVLSGANNDSDYAFLGTIWENAAALSYSPGRKSRIGVDAPSARAISWLVKLLNIAPERLLVQARVWHEGRCGRCGRRLTVPSSIASGLGPECAGRV